MEPNLTILPAIDLKDGMCVRLRQGRIEDQTVYGRDPEAMAAHWRAEGAEFLHVVDLDGAFQGRPIHLDAIARIVRAAGVPVEVGGGLRTDEDIERVLATGVARVILGTRACAQPEEVRRLAARYGERLAIGIDARNGLVQVKGWTETSTVRTIDLATDMAQAGVQTLIVTDTALDGMLGGTNVGVMSDLCAAVSCNIIASGGIATVQDVHALTALRRPNLVGAIVGKALYEGTVRLADLTAAARAPEA